mmetsp:Transcript_8484/g.12990  ORF Transcript_8484/g.12990 Transcript_8484/m.12990 type:complete len:100 (+) Transcript_8484:3554-3853(+)
MFYAGEEEKERQYEKMGMAYIKKKKLHFSGIQNFSNCLIKYFKSILSRVLAEDDENYGGLNLALAKFQEHVFTSLKQDPQLGLRGGMKRAQIQQSIRQI